MQHKQNSTTETIQPSQALGYILAGSLFYAATLVALAQLFVVTL